MSSNPKQDIGVKKAPLSLVPPALSIAVSAALADGAAKYGAYNYRQAGVKASIYYEAALRHLAALWDGEEVASDSGVEHLAHAAACLAILLDTKSIGRMVDDRPPAGGAAELLAKADKSKASASEGPTGMSLSDDYCSAIIDGIWACTRARRHSGLHLSHTFGGDVLASG